MAPKIKACCFMLWLGLILILSMGLLPCQALSSTRGISVNAKTPSGQTKEIDLYSGYHALVIGAGAYTEGWPRLPNPVRDAQEVAEALKDMGWEVELIRDLEAASLKRALNKLVIGPGRDPSKAILVWFSGHGHTLEEADGTKLGYIVPVDAPNPDQDILGFMGQAPVDIQECILSNFLLRKAS